MHLSPTDLLRTVEKKEKQRRVKAAQSNLTAPSQMLQSNLTTAPSQTVVDDDGNGNDDSMIVHTHNDNGDDNNDIGNQEIEELEEEEEEEEEDIELCYGPWQCLSDREIGRGSTPLHLGVEAGQPVCVSMLLRAGANTELIRQDGYTALQLAGTVPEPFDYPHNLTPSILMPLFSTLVP